MDSLPYYSCNTACFYCIVDSSSSSFMFQSLSVECGMSTGCLKIYKKADQFDRDGAFIPPHKRTQDLQLFRGEFCPYPCLVPDSDSVAGCFLVSTADTCHDSSNNGLSYCWCSHTDLCNRGGRLSHGLCGCGVLPVVVLALFGLLYSGHVL